MSLEAEVDRLANERNTEVVIALTKTVRPVCAHAALLYAFIGKAKEYHKHKKHQRRIDKYRRTRYNAAEAEIAFPDPYLAKVVELLAEVRDLESQMNCCTPCDDCAGCRPKKRAWLCQKCLKFYPHRKRGKHVC